MCGEKNLHKLLAKMSPELIDGEYVFCTFPNAGYGEYPELNPFAAISEAEGLTLIIPKNIADKKNLSYESIFRGITLNVHSSLNAIGLTAALSGKLAGRGISANIVAGYYHDHVFVPSHQAETALAALKELSGR